MTAGHTTILTRRLLSLPSNAPRLSLRLARSYSCALLATGGSSGTFLRRRILGAGSALLLPDFAASAVAPAVRRGSSKDEADKQQQQRLSQPSPDVPRRIVVKPKRDANNKAEQGGIDRSRLRERVGVLIPKKSSGFQKAFLRKRARGGDVPPIVQKDGRESSAPTTSEVKDASGQPILILGTPPSPLRASVDEEARKGDGGGGGGTTTGSASKKRIRLPIVNASALLDKQHYCVQSANAATSRSGTEAARRLQRGKQELVSVLRQEILSRTPATPTASLSSSVVPPPYYVLQGHGVPPQLLQAHIDFADSLLKLCHANACSFSNAALQVDWLKTRRHTDNNNHVVPWSAAVALGRDDVDLNHAMNLYLTVMDRVARALGLVLPPSLRSQTASQGLSPPALDEYDNEWTVAPEYSATTLASVSGYVSSASGGAYLKHWRAEFLRGKSVSPDWLPDAASPVPLVEWTPLPGTAAPGRVTIRLQGYPTRPLAVVTETTRTVSLDGTTTTSRTKPVRRKRPQALSLVFDACFRN